MLAESTITSVREFSGIVECISQYVTLKKRGRNFIGLCPFHSEKTPSFTVSAEKQIFHCFGCHESGDLIAFVQKVDNLSFSESVIQIAQFAGISVEKQEKGTDAEQYRQKQKDIFFDECRALMSDVKSLYVEGLNHNSDALNYLKQRGLHKKTIETFEIGCEPDGVYLASYLLDKGYSEEHLKQSGLFYLNHNQKKVSRFRGRIVFPIVDYLGRTMGFSGRIYKANDRKDVAKYINSEESLLFNKRKLLYGLNLAKKVVRHYKSFLVTEGYMDVLMAHQHGFENCVAIMGTSLTDDQAKKMKRFSSTVILAMDGDEAGQKAIERSYEVLQKLDFKVSIISLDSEDIADYITRQGSEALQNRIKSALSIFEFSLNRLLKIHPSNIHQNISLIIKEMIPIIQLETDPIMQRYYSGVLAKKIGVDDGLVLSRVNQDPVNIKQGFIAKSKSKSKVVKAEEYLLFSMISCTTAREKIFNMFSSDNFTLEHHKGVASLCHRSSKVGKDLLEESTQHEHRQLLTRLMFEFEGSPIHESVLKSHVKAIHQTENHLKIQQIKEEIKQLEDAGHDQEVNALLNQLQSIIKQDA